MDHDSIHRYVKSCGLWKNILMWNHDWTHVECRVSSSTRSTLSFFAKEVEQSGTCEAPWQVPQHDLTRVKPHSYFSQKSIPKAPSNSGLREEILRAMGHMGPGMSNLTCQGWGISLGHRDGICRTRGLWEVTVLKKQTPASTKTHRRVLSCVLICFFSQKDSTSQSFTIILSFNYGITLPRWQMWNSETKAGKKHPKSPFSSALTRGTQVSHRFQECLRLLCLSIFSRRCHWRTPTRAGIPSCFTAISCTP